MAYTIYEKIKQLRISQGLSQSELATKMGYRSRSTINKIESGKVDIARNKISKFAEVLGVTTAYLMGWDEPEQNTPINANLDINFIRNRYVKIPVLGSVVAGAPIEAIEDIIDYEEIPESMARRGEYFALVVKGDSMHPELSDGDIVIVKKQSDVDTGDIAIVLINGDEATIKEIKKYPYGIELIGRNPLIFPTRSYTNEDISNLPIEIIGKVVESRRRY